MTAIDLSRLQPSTFVTINIDNILFQKSVVAGICLFLIIIEFSVLLVSLNNEYKYPASKSPSNNTRSQGIRFIAITYLNLGFRYYSYTILHFSLLEPELENLTENPLLLWLNHLYQILGMVVCVVCNILVVVGIKKDSPNYLIPWLAVYIVGIKYYH